VELLTGYPDRRVISLVGIQEKSGKLSTNIILNHKKKKIKTHP
jgi:hypothetical protein